MISPRHAPAIACALAGLASGPTASADPLTREQCLDAHSRGQDARDEGKLSLARKLFLTCAQPACPALVQSDCARFTDDLTREQPSLTFVARDAQGADLPDTAVYVDDSLIATRLDDGRPHDVDPGRHTVRFSSGGKDQLVTLVVGAGEKGRVVTVVFSAINPAPPAAMRAAAAPTPREPEVSHPRASRYLIVAGAAATLTGGVLGVLGVHAVPSSCSISTHHCAAAPNDGVFDQARSGMQLADVGIAVGAVGAVTLAGGLVWYYARATTERPGQVVIPVVTRDGAGLALSGTF
ncbi:MAG: hypothetical protein E6J90_35505 [Deltaproteobacteria bacterium]|nr:MAG: hypothetical protein E6J91_47085 [Deltaproteobacteria bacterium]TMQ10988.1 MAG: hypothetical protein E6J90_35505 [Deltaproteobacteria bacterium]